MTAGLPMPDFAALREIRETLIAGGGVAATYTRAAGGAGFAIKGYWARPSRLPTAGDYDQDSQSLQVEAAAFGSTPPVKFDRLVIDGQTRTVRAVQVLRVDSTVLGYRLTLEGG